MSRGGACPCLARVLDTTPLRAHHQAMPSKRVAQVLRVAAELPDRERAELARALVRSLPEPDTFELDDDDGFSADWTDEIKRRLRDEPPGEALSFEELRERIDGMIAHGE